MSNYNLSTFDFHTPQDLANEAFSYEENARYDYHSELYAADLRSLENEIAGEAAYYESLEAEERGLTVEALRAEYAAKEALRLEAEKCADCRRRVYDSLIPF